MKFTNERLDQLANDPLMCNITPEVQEYLRELIAMRVAVANLSRRFCANHAATPAGDRLLRSDGSCEMCAKERTTVDHTCFSCGGKGCIICDFTGHN